MFSTRGSHWHHFPSCPRGLKKGRTPLSDYFISGGESVLGGWRPRAAAEETLVGTTHGTRAFVQESTENPQSHVSPRFSSSWSLCIQRVVETKRKGFFQLPALFRSPVKTSSGPIFQLPLEGQRASFAWRHHAPCSWSSSLYTHSSSTFSFPDQDRCNNQKISECCDFCDIP